jgi:CYTH domain-containing protein
MIEIERKFLVLTDAYKKDASTSYAIKQGFLNSHAERTVRVRLKEGIGVLTIKGKSSEDGLSRYEWEKEIPFKDAEELFKLCEEGTIEKLRSEVKSGDHLFEIDEFFGENEGLVIAEIELNNENEHFEKPDWLGEEVTGDIRYYNSQLSKHPFSQWNK